MDQISKSIFDGTCYGRPRQRRGHIPTIRIKGLSVQCACSCGAKSIRSTFGNRAGRGYAVAAQWHWYMQHTGQGA